jgi:hypothetical protein
VPACKSHNQNLLFDKARSAIHVECRNQKTHLKDKMEKIFFIIGKMNPSEKGLNILFRVLFDFA